MSFNPNEHLRKLGKGDKAQDYLDVKWRLVWFREKYPHGSITTEELAYDLDREVTSEERVWNNTTRQMEPIIKRAFGYARYRAIVEDGEGGHATGTKSENAASFPDFGEKAETGAIGRALAALGFGTQFAPEMDEEHRIVDSPVDRTPTPPAKPQAVQATNGDGVKSRLNAVYNAAVKQSLIKRNATPEEFLAYLSTLINANITHVDQITESRLHVAEQFIMKQQKSA